MTSDGTSIVNTIVSQTDTSLVLKYQITIDANNYQGETITLKK